MNCQETIDLMGDAMDGAVRAGLLTGFEEHLAECPACRNYYENLALTREALRRLPRPSATSPNRDDLLREFSDKFHGKKR